MTHLNIEIKNGDTVATRTVVCTLNRSEDIVSNLYKNKGNQPNE